MMPNTMPLTEQLISFAKRPEIHNRMTSNDSSAKPFIVDTPLDPMREIYTYFHEPANIVQIQVANAEGD